MKGNPMLKRFIGLDIKSNYFKQILLIFFSATLAVTGIQGVLAESVYNDYSIELTIKYNKDTRVLDVISQRILDFPPPKNRSGKIEAKDLVLEYTNSADETIGMAPVIDPTLLRAEWPEDHSGTLGGKRQKVAESVFQVRLPVDEGINQIKLLKQSTRPSSQTAYQRAYVNGLTISDEVMTFDVLGSSSFDNTEVKAFIESKNNNTRK